MSSITIKNFDFKPNKNTKEEIWRYLNASNLIKFEDVTDKNRLSELEIAANEGQLNRKQIFKIYQQIPYELSELINAKNIYQTLQGDARSLIYQKFLLSEDNETKIEYLLLLEDLFKKDNLQEIYTKFLSDKIVEMGLKIFQKNFKK